jgi:hypothetical protein
MPHKLLDAIWPRLDNWNPDLPTKDDTKTKDQVNTILKTSWRTDQEVALKAAYGIAEYEEERRRAAESKASTCLLTVAALIPILTYMENTILGGKEAGFSQFATLPILITAVLYLAAAGFWALRTMAVGTYCTTDANDLSRIWLKVDPIQKLIAETLVATRYNQHQVNQKVSAYKMAYAFLYRSIFAFSVLLIVQVSFTLYRIASA